MCIVSFTTELVQPALWPHDYQCQNALRSLGTEREDCSGLTYFVQAPYMITVCAELSLVHPDPTGDTVHSLDNPFSTCTGGPKHLMSDMKDTCCEVHLCVTSKTTECAETVLDKSDHSAGCAGCSHGSQDTAGSLIYLWEWQLLLGQQHLHS